MCIYHAVPGLEQADGQTYGEWLLVLFVLIKICINFFFNFVTNNTVKAFLLFVHD